MRRPAPAGRARRRRSGAAAHRPPAAGSAGRTRGGRSRRGFPRFPIRFGTLACSSRNRPRSTAAAASSGPRRHTPGLRGASTAPRPSVAPGSSLVPPVPGVPGGCGRPAVPSAFTGSGWEAVVRPRSPPSAVAAEGSSGRRRGSGRVREAGVRADSGDRVMPPVKAGAVARAYALSDTPTIGAGSYHRTHACADRRGRALSGGGIRDGLRLEAIARRHRGGRRHRAGAAGRQHVRHRRPRP